MHWRKEGWKSVEARKNEKEAGGNMKLQGIEEMRVDEFKYLASTIQSNVQCTERKKWGSVEWMEMSVRKDLLERSSKNKREGL